MYSLADGDPLLLSDFGDDDYLPPPNHAPTTSDRGSNRSKEPLQHRRSSSSEAGKSKNHGHSAVQVHSHSNSTNLQSHSHSTISQPSDSASPPRPQTIIPAGEIEKLVRRVLENKLGPGGGGGWDQRSVSDRELHMLLFSVLESVSSLRDSRGTSKISATLRLLQNMTSLFEDLLGLWLQLHKEPGAQQRHGKERRTQSVDFSLRNGTNGEVGSGLSAFPYSGSLHLARITLRLWLRLSSQLLHSSLQHQHLADVQPLLHAPLETVSKTCYNLQQVGVFRGNHSLDHEFTLVVLEGLFSGLYVDNLFPNVHVCQVSSLYEALRDTLTDGCQEWFAYLCSKLHGVSDANRHAHFPDSAQKGSEEPSRQDEAAAATAGESSNWSPILSYSYSLLTHLLAELLHTHSHIKTCQQAFKVALTSTGPSFGDSSHSRPFPFRQPITYSLEEATGFDKLTFRLSKMAELLLSMFKQVPRVQLLSLQLLSETTKDTIGVIGNFLSIISDRSIYSNSKVLDPYLELLEDVWFRLSPDYTGAAPWNKLSNYLSLLMESDFQVVCQVIYHLQCLFSHESSTLRSKLTKKVIIPYHTHLMTLVKTKCFKATTIVTSERGGGGGGGGGGEKKSKKAKNSTTKVTEVVQMGYEADLEEEERVVLSLFLKLLAKVVSHPQSLGTFGANGTNLYSLFLLLPLDGFRSAGLRVLEECLYTLHNFGSSPPVYTPPGSNIPSPVGSLVGIATTTTTATTAPSSAESASPVRPDETGIQKTLLSILLSVAYSVQIEKIPDQCLSIAEGRASLPKYGLAEADEVHKLIVSTFEHKTLTQLLVPGFIRHISVMADVWSLLSRLATRADQAAEILRHNHIWDVVQVFGPSLANVLSRLHQRVTREGGKGTGKVVEESVRALRECGVGLLSHLLVLAHPYDNCHGN